MGRISLELLKKEDVEIRSLRKLHPLNNSYGQLYSITEFGDVYSHKSGIFLRPGNTNGYLSVILCNGSKKDQKQVYIHRLVCEVFHGLRPDMHIDHLDMQKGNNHYSNLEYVTKAQNTQRMALKLDLIPPKQLGIKNPKAKLTEIQVLNIRDEYKNGVKFLELSKKYGVSREMIGNIVSRRNWKHI